MKLSIYIMFKRLKSWFKLRTTYCAYCHSIGHRTVWHEYKCISSVKSQAFAYAEGIKRHGIHFHKLIQDEEIRQMIGQYPIYPPE